MRKTILTVATAVMLMATTAIAANPTHETLGTNTAITLKGEVSSFCKAIMKGDIATVKKLIDLGEDVNGKSLGMTPAIFAARYNKAEILEVLIENGADLNIRCNKGWSIKKYAELSNATAALAVLKNQV